MEKRVAVKIGGPRWCWMGVAPARPSHMLCTAIGHKVTRLSSHDQLPGRGASAPGLGVKRAKGRVRESERKTDSA